MAGGKNRVKGQEFMGDGERLIFPELIWILSMKCRACLSKKLFGSLQDLRYSHLTTHSFEDDFQQG